MQNELTASIQALSQSLMIVNNISRGMLQFIILTDRHLTPFLQRALNTGKERSYGHVSLKELEALRGKRLAILSLNDRLKDQLMKECKDLNIVFHAKKEDSDIVQQQIQEKELALMDAIETNDTEKIKAAQEELNQVKENEKWTVFIDDGDINKMKWFLDKYDIKIEDVKAIEEVLSDEQVAMYEKLGIAKEEIEHLRKEPITEVQQYVLEKNPQKLKDGGYIRVKERVNDFIPKNKLEAIEVIGYLYGRIDTIPAVERIAAVQEIKNIQIDSDGDGFTDIQELAQGSDTHDFQSTPKNTNHPLLPEIEEKLEKLNEMKEKMPLGLKLEINANTTIFKEIIATGELSGLEELHSSIDKVMNKVTTQLPKIKM